MKKYLFERYRLINISLLLILLLLLTFMNVKYEDWFKDTDIYYFLEYFDGIYAPIFSGGKWLVGILGVLLFVPSHVFRKWLYFVAPPIVLLTFFLVQGISVYSTNLINPTRAKMAENGMIFLAVVTVVFVIGHVVYDKRKKKIT